MWELGGLIVATVYCVMRVALALQSGGISFFSGWPAVRYRREDQPFGYWASIVAFCLIPLAFAYGVFVA